MVVNPDQTHLMGWVRPFVLVLVVLGCVFRFGNITGTYVRNDEGQTWWVISGSSPEEIRGRLFDGTVHVASEVLEYQRPRPGARWLDVVRNLARFDPKQAPCYYLGARAWVLLFGPSVAVLRSFGALLGVLCLPLVFLLTRELFQDRLTAWVAVGVVAVSPIHVVYNRDARPYALWVIFILLCSWLLLVAVRRSREQGRIWSAGFLAYGIALTAAFFTQPLTVLLAAAHLLFVFAEERLRWTPTVRATLIAQIAAGLLFLPLGILVLGQLTGMDSGLHWLRRTLEFREWLRGSAAMVMRIFFDVEGPGYPSHTIGSGLVLLAIVLGACGFAWRSAPRRAQLFVLAVFSACSAPMLAADLVLGGIRMWRWKYQFPSVIVLQLCAAFAIAYVMARPERMRRAAAILLVVMVVAAGIASGIAIQRAPVWWHGLGARPMPMATEVLNGCKDPLVIIQYRNSLRAEHVLAVSHHLDGHVRLLLVDAPPWPEFSADEPELFLYQPRERDVDASWNLERVADINLYRFCGSTERREVE